MQIISNLSENSNYNNLLDMFQNSPIPAEECLNNLGLFIKRQQMSRIMFMYELYKKIINVHGSIIEFGVRWGQDLVLFESFRGMLEPFNYNRKIIGFDTWEGFPSVSKYDGNNHVGDMNVVSEYENYLYNLLQLHENSSPISHIKKSEIIKGDAINTFEEYLKQHQELIIAFVYFDLDIYQPTKACLELCKKRLIKGSVIGFDQLNHIDFPGECVAFREVFNLNEVKLERFPFTPNASYFIME